MADIGSFFGLRDSWLLGRVTSSAGELVTWAGLALLVSFTAEGLVESFTDKGRWVNLVVAGVGLVVSWETRSLVSWGLTCRGLATRGLATSVGLTRAGRETRGLDTAWGLERPPSRILATFGALSRGLTALADVWPVLGLDCRLGLLSLATSLLPVAWLGLPCRVA